MSSYPVWGAFLYSSQWWREKKGRQREKTVVVDRRHWDVYIISLLYQNYFKRKNSRHFIFALILNFNLIHMATALVQLYLQGYHLKEINYSEIIKTWFPRKESLFWNARGQTEGWLTIYRNREDRERQQTQGEGLKIGISEERGKTESQEMKRKKYRMVKKWQKQGTCDFYDREQRKWSNKRRINMEKEQRERRI